MHDTVNTKNTTDYLEWVFMLKKKIKQLFNNYFHICIHHKVLQMQ